MTRNLIKRDTDFCDWNTGANINFPFFQTKYTEINFDRLIFYARICVFVALKYESTLNATELIIESINALLEAHFPTAGDSRNQIYSINPALFNQTYPRLSSRFLPNIRI